MGGCRQGSVKGPKESLCHVPSGSAMRLFLAEPTGRFTGLDWEGDRETAHLFITNDASKDSDARACIKPLMMQNNGRLDTKANHAGPRQCCQQDLGIVSLQKRTCHGHCLILRRLAVRSMMET
jgi:hypothetical protein